jgi:Do/DeqQ family serine protease
MILRRHLIGGLIALLLAAPAFAAERAVPGSLAEVQLSYAPVVQQVAPAVVNIYTRRVVETRWRSPLFRDPLFERFFGQLFPGPPQERIQNSLGSGVIVAADGLIVTNYHVIEHAEEITVALADRREFEATLVGTDEPSDLAVLRIDVGGESLPWLELGDSDAIAVGDIVLAIGNPFGVGQTVTSGIVSAIARTAAVGRGGGAFIQTDAAINPGNSGGALVTLDGRLIGINTAIFTRSGGSIGIGFAIPSNLVRVVVDSVAGGGEVVEPWVGVDVQPVTADIASSLGLGRPTGVLVKALHPGSPAAAAGIGVGDVVLAIDGHEVFDADGFHFRLRTRRVGERARFTVLSHDGARDVEVALIAPPEVPPRDVRTLQGRNPLAGAVVANLSPALARELGLEGDPTGVIVLEVESGPAARIGIRPGDIVVAVAGIEIDRTETLVRVLSEARDEWPLAIRRNGEVLRVVVR